MLLGNRGKRKPEQDRFFKQALDRMDLKRFFHSSIDYLINCLQTVIVNQLMSYLMSRILALTDSKQTGALWRLSLVLLLLCGIASYTGADPRGAAAGTSSTFVAELNEIAFAGNADNLRVRPDARKGHSVPNTDDNDEPSWEIAAARLVEFDVRSSRVSGYNPSSSQIPRVTRYLLQVPRAPPSV